MASAGVTKLLSSMSKPASFSSLYKVEVVRIVLLVTKITRLFIFFNEEIASVAPGML